MLGRSDELAVALGDLRVYRTGVEFTVSARCRGQLARRGGVLGALSGHRHPWHGGDADLFLLGFEFSDGRWVSNIARERDPFAASGDHGAGPWLTHTGGGGSTRSADQDFYLCPLPPGDRLSVITAWPSLGITEARQQLDAAAIRAAAEQAIELWPIEPDDEQLEPPPPPLLPPGSWFDRT